MADSTQRRRLLAAAVSGVALGLPMIAASAADKGKASSDAWHVRVEVPGDVTIGTGERPSVKIDAEPGVRDKIQASINGHSIDIHTTGSFQTQQPIRITVVAGPVGRLEVMGTTAAMLSGATAPILTAVVGDTASLALSDVNLDQLSLDIRGSAGVQASGSATQQHLKLADAASFDGSELSGDVVRAELSGSSDAAVAARSKLQAKVRDAAGLTYRGEPQIESSVQDAGSLSSE
ncbi:MAG: DUF2807 domain-containing protein [Burkholderiaceae bacterium]